MIQHAEAALHTPHTPLPGAHADEAVHVLLVLGHVGVPHLGAGQTSARHAAGQLLLGAHPVVGARQREAKAAHLIHECRVNDSRGCTLDGLLAQLRRQVLVRENARDKVAFLGKGDTVLVVKVLHLFLLGDFIEGAGRKINFYFLGVCVKGVCSGELEIFELLGDDALDGLNLLLIPHALLSIVLVRRWSLKDGLAAVNDAKDAAVEFLLELLRRPVRTTLDRTAEPAFGLV